MNNAVVTLSSGTLTEGDTDLTTELENILAADTPWNVIVWNDPVNLMTYVAYVFRSHFGYSRARAEELMLQVHHNGKAIVFTARTPKSTPRPCTPGVCWPPSRKWRTNGTPLPTHPRRLHRTI